MKKLLTVFFCAITLCAMASELKPTAKVESGVFTYITFPSGPGTKTGWMCLDSGFLRVSNMQIASLGTDTLIVMYGRDSAFAVLGLSAFRTLLNSGYLLLSDTASMLANRLKISDTLTMLSNRIKISDTSLMLNNRLKISDTVTMLSGYQRTGSGGTISSVIGTANQITAITSGGAVSLTLSTGIILSGSLSTTGIITAGSLSIGGTLTSNIGGATTMNTVSITNGLNASSVTGIGGSASIAGFNSITGITLNGIIGTAAQSNITSLGSLTNLTVVGNANITGSLSVAGMSATGTTRIANLIANQINTDFTYPFSQDGNVILGLAPSGQISAMGSNTGTNRLTYDQTPSRLNVTNLAVTGTITTSGLSVSGIINAAGITVTGALQANSFSGTLITLAPGVSQTGFDMRNGSTVLQIYPNSVIISPINPFFKTTVSLDNLTTGAGVGVAGIKNKINIDTNRVIITNTSASGVSHSQTMFTNGALLADISNTFPTVAGELATGVKYMDGTNVTTQQSGAGFSTTGTITAGTLAGTLSTAAQPNITSVGILTIATVTGSLSSIGTGGFTGGNQQIHGSLSDNAAIGSVKAVARFDNNCAGCIVRQIWSDDNLSDFIFTYTPSNVATTELVKWSLAGGFLSMNGNGLLATSLGTGAVQATAGVLSVVSDSRLKTLTGKLNGSAISALRKLPLPQYWKFNSKSGMPLPARRVSQFGFLADQVNKVLGEEFAPKQPNGYFGLNDRALLSLNFQIDQEQQKKIDDLESTVKIQNNIIKLLIDRINEIDKRTKK